MEPSSRNDRQSGRADQPARPEPENQAPQLSPDELRRLLVQRLNMSGAISSSAVERAMLAVPRHVFLPGIPLADAYADVAVPTHWENGAAVSSASQPAMVAIMLEQLQLAPGMRVLEVGAGTGYNAALLATLTSPSGAVTTVDIDPEIVAEAREHLDAAGYPDVLEVAADGAAGWPERAPYDRVMLTVGASDIAPAWFDQLTEGGLLVLPLLLNGAEASVAFRKRNGILISESLSPCGFMRLRGAEAGQEQSLALPDGRRLFGQYATDLATCADLLRTRPRRRLWTRPVPAFLQYLGLRGYNVVALYPRQQPVARPRFRGRWGIYAVDESGPSLALFAATLPVLLIFGGPAAERILEAEGPVWQRSSFQPIERWRVTAYPNLVMANTPRPAPPGATRLVRRHFTYDIETNVPAADDTDGTDDT